jgi:hypothetical protein
MSARYVRYPYLEEHASKFVIMRVCLHTTGAPESEVKCWMHTGFVEMDVKIT